jgi:hypothetical protein
MTVSESVYSGANAYAFKSVYVYLSGTKAEVIQAIVNAGINASKVVYYTDDGTDAKALYSKKA